MPSAIRALWLTLALILGLATAVPTSTHAATPPADRLTVSGVISTAQGKGVKEARLEFFLNGHKLDTPEEILTSREGKYVAELRLPAGSLQAGKAQMRASRPAFADSGLVEIERLLRAGGEEGGGTSYLAHQGLVLARSVNAGFWIAALVLVIVYVLIALELMHRTLAALLGGAALLAVSYTAGVFWPDYFVLSYEDAIAALDMNVIFLLMAMMIIVGVMKKTGVFQWLAYKAYQAARGNVMALSAILMVLTAVASAFLDNVTTMLLIIPVTMEIAGTLKINPVTLLMPEVFASNVGGAATLIGDPPNIMIGSYAKLSFVDFAGNLSVICLVCLAFTVVWFVWWYRKDYRKAVVADVPRMIEYLRESYRITDTKLLVMSGVILAITIVLFVMHGALHMEPSVAALIGAAVLLVVSRVDIVEMLEHEIEWPTLIFFMFLFMVVAGAEETGLIQVIADWVKDMSQGSVVLAIIMVLWVSAIASAFIDNIPFTATMLPIVAYLTQVIPGVQGGVLWWALALGACLGGNGTLIGASANVVTAGMAERAGYPISFMGYMKVAFVPMLVTIILSMAWLLLVEI
jgi:Na+/H+ antiporter NhaD/arsenite permease-like protein